MDDSLCEKEFLRIGLSFWTGQSCSYSTFDSHTAASVGDMAFISEMPESILDTGNHSGWTPLMYASYHGHLNLVNFLLSKGCSVEKANGKGRSPLILSAMCGNTEIISLILSKCKKRKTELVRTVDQRNMTALSHAVKWGHVQLAETLLRAGSSPDQTEHSRGHSLLMMASCEGNVAMVELLLQWGADTGYQTVLGDTAVTVAQARGHDMVAKLILRSSVTFPSALAAPAKVEKLLEAKKLASSQKPHSLSQLLDDLGLEKYTELFKENEIDLSLLLTMNDEELRQIGITKLGPRRKLTAAIDRIQSKSKDY